MSLAAGSRLGTYEVLSSIGAGGMGEVYRARDTTLHRDVALKVLPEAFASDPDRLARFEREAQLLASLNHPNIAAIYGFHDNALVLELVEGPTLADRIAVGPLPLDEALPIARQIADALDAAHEHGVIHRDLKPSNIKVRPDGTVKVLDFGLAKALEPVNGSSEVSRSPTITSPAMTRMGMVLGTAAYMSPEQARGHQADRRSDVWAFGCVLYEMLTGTRVFDMREMSDTIAAVLRAEPDWTKLSAQVPEPITTLLHRCLEKDSRRRLRDIGDARLELDARAESTVSGPIATASRRRERIVWTTAVAVLLLAALGLAAWAIRPPLAPAEVRLTIETPGESDPRDLASLAVSPDGLNVAFVAAVEGQPHVWVRPLGALAARPLLGTAGASVPFWSADSRSVAFYADGWLKRIDLAGGLVRNLTKAVFGFGGAWNRDGTILFVPTPASVILRTSADGAAPVPVTRREGDQSGHAHPHFLPDGRHFLYFAQGPSETRGIYVGDIDGPVTRKLFDADSAAVYTSGYLLFVRQATLFAQAFDEARLETTGNPLKVADDVRGSFLAGLSAAGGLVAFRAGPTGTGRQFVWLDRTGKEIGRVADRDSEKLAPSVSPDGGRLAFFGRVNGTNTDIWLLETRRGVLTRFTDHAADDIAPVWSRDGSRIAYSSNQGGSWGLYQKSTTAAGREELLISGADVGMATDWSPGDRILLYQRDEDIWALPMLGSERKPFPVIQTESDEREGMFSPDGRSMAYVSNSSGGFEAYVRPFPGPGPAVRVSTRGGAQVRWRADGRELFYVALDGTLMAVPIEMSANGLPLTPGEPKPLFTTHIGRVINAGGTGPNYIVSGDGQQFLMSIIAQEISAAPIRLFVNWKPPQQ